MGILDDKDVRVGLGLFSEITGLIAFPVIAGTILGRWLDDKYNSDPWFVIFGAAMGILVASVTIANLVKKYNRK